MADIPEFLLRTSVMTRKPPDFGEFWPGCCALIDLIADWQLLFELCGDSALWN